MSSPFILREMRPSDGPALKRLMENDPEPPGWSMVTRFVVDPYQAWMALKPGMVGVVAEAPDVEGLVGTATVAFEDIQFQRRVLPSASLENLKVDHAFRGNGLGTRLAQWRVDTARARFGDEGVITTGTSTDNTASLATMKKWCKEIFQPMILAPQPARREPPEPQAGVTVRPAEGRDLAEIAEKSNRFYADYNLYAPLSVENLGALLNGSMKVYHYYIAVDDSGSIVAGMLISERSKLMVDEFRNAPPPMRKSPMFPPDGLLRLLEVGSVWFNRRDAGQHLWQHIRWEFRDRITTLSGVANSRSPLHDVFQAPPDGMKLELVVAVNGPTLMGTEKLVSGRLRG